jgi:hypothetical protein
MIMMDFTLSNCKDLDVRKVTCGIRECKLNCVKLQ